MTKYLISLLSLLRLLFIKYFLRRNIRFHFIQSHSPFISIKMKNCSHLVLGKNVQISSGCDIHLDNNATIDIGQRTYFNKRCILSSHNKISIGSNCLFGPDVKIYDNNHVYEYGKGVVPGQHKSFPITIGNNCWIAANVVILKGSTIGDNCIIGTGCIIKGNIPSNSITTLKQTLSNTNLIERT